MGTDSAATILRLIMRHSADPIVLKSIDGRFLDLNHAALQRMGMELEQVRGLREADLPGADLELAVEHDHQLRVAAHRSEPQVYLRAFVDPSGQERVYRATYIGLGPDADHAVLILGQELHDAEERDREVVRREGILRATLSAVASGLWEFDVPSGMLRNDERWYRIFGIEPSGHDGTVESFVQRIHPEDRELVLARVGACMEGRAASYVSEHRMVRKDDGRTIWVRDAGRVTSTDAEGKATFMVGAVVDISELKAQQEALEQARAVAEQASYAKSRFLANMSHELRTPMTGVLGMLEELLDSTLDPDQQRVAQTALDSARGLLTIVNDILDSSKLEAGALTLERVGVSLPDLLRQLGAMFGSTCEARGLSLSLVAVEGCPEAMLGDPTRLKQVLVNLVGNAIKFTERGEVKVEVSALEGQLRFRVIDSGIGIQAAALGSLFERFTQADVSTTRRFGGTGLGLSITKQLVELMGGQLEVRSEPGQGSCFSFALPLEVAELRAEHAVEALPEPGRPLSILLAEDVVVNQMVVRRLLERHGHRVHVVGNGREAVRAVEAEVFDVVLMDVHMPEMDGVEATRAIRGLPGPQSRVPIVALTANAMKGDREAYLEAGMDDYASKPVERAELFAALVRVTAP